MNNLRDPFSLRNKPATFHLLHQNLRAASLTISTEVTTVTKTKTRALQQAALPAIETAVEKLEEVMSGFSIPKNVPSFTSPNREFEDVAWAAATSKNGGNSPRTPRSAMAGITEGMFGRDRDLPLYKDKPYYHHNARQRRKWLRKRVLGIVAVVGLALWWFGVFTGVPGMIPMRGEGAVGGKKSGGGSGSGGKIDWEERREAVKDVFVQSWEAYEKHAWGYDEFHPLSKKGRQMVPKGMGWIIIDSLDTLMLMNLTTPLAHAVEWLSSSHTFDQDHEVNTFETTIRILGGLLSAHYLQNDLHIVPPAPGSDADIFLEKATDLADRLLGAYDSPSGIPYASVNLHHMKGVPSHADGGASSTAEAATLQLEMKYLSNLTGEAIHWAKAESVIAAIDSLNAEDGLVPIFIYADDGTFRGKEIRLGSRGDSYYEYLLKQYLQTSKGEPLYRDMYDEAMAGVKKHLIAKSHPSHLTFIGELPGGIGGEFSPKMDHLVCFMAGSFALGATEGLPLSVARKSPTWGAQQEEDMRLARELMRTCYEMYAVTPTGLAPEIVWFNMRHDKDGVTGELDEEDTSKDIQIKPRDAHNLQRPETVESLFLMWRITGDQVYREWGWAIFEAFVKHAAVEGGEGGFTSLDTVMEVPPRMRDNMESFWLAETLKYLYLLFSPTDILPLDEIVWNTEAHPLPRFKMGRLLKTGWERKLKTQA